MIEADMVDGHAIIPDLYVRIGHVVPNTPISGARVLSALQSLSPNRKELSEISLL